MENSTLRNLIKKKRKAKDITQDDVAAKLKMNRTTYAAKEQKGNFTDEELTKVAAFLNISEGELNMKTPIPVDTGVVAGKIIQIEAMQRVSLTVLQELYSKALGITNMEAGSVIDKTLAQELQKLKEELR